MAGIDEIVSLAKVLQVTRILLVSSPPLLPCPTLPLFPTPPPLLLLPSSSSSPGRQERQLRQEEDEDEEVLKVRQERTQFVGVSIASALSFAESERLVQVRLVPTCPVTSSPFLFSPLFFSSHLTSSTSQRSKTTFLRCVYYLLSSSSLLQGLKERGVAIDNLVVNQLLGDTIDPAAVTRIVKAQAKCIKELEDLSASAPLQQPDASPVSQLSLSASPFFLLPSPPPDSRSRYGSIKSPSSTRSFALSMPSARSHPPSSPARSPSDTFGFIHRITHTTPEPQPRAPPGA
eukprot:620182-Hanusia_phi.AAC.4